MLATCRLVTTMCVAAVSLAACGHGNHVSGDTGSLVLYPGEPNADDQDGRGLLVREGNCLYLQRSNGSRVLLAFPQRDTSWDEDRQAVRRGGRALRVGEEIEVGGSTISIPADEFEWAVPPDPTCDTRLVWLVG